MRRQWLAPGGVGEDWPPRLGLLQASARGLTFAGHRRAQAPLLLCPALLVLAVLPWLSSEPVTGLRWLVFASCLGSAAALARWSWPRRYRLHLRRDDDGDAANPDAVPPAELRWILDTEPEPDCPRGAYILRLEENGREGWTVLRNSNPGPVLRGLRSVLQHWPAPVECRWGLPASARPWSFEPRPAAASPASEPSPRAVLSAPVCSRGLRWTMTVMTLVMLAELAFLVLSESAKLSRVHVLSAVLPVITAAGLVAITSSLATARTRLSITARVLAELSVLGIRRPRGDVDVASVRGVYAIGAGAAERWHVLVDSHEGPLAVPVERTRAEVMARETRVALSETQLSRG
jgi:hypothetical protein